MAVLELARVETGYGWHRTQRCWLSDGRVLERNGKGTWVLWGQMPSGLSGREVNDRVRRAVERFLASGWHEVSEEETYRLTKKARRV